MSKQAACASGWHGAVKGRHAYLYEVRGHRLPRLVSHGGLQGGNLLLCAPGRGAAASRLATLAPRCPLRLLRPAGRSRQPGGRGRFRRGVCRPASVCRPVLARGGGVGSRLCLQRGQLLGGFLAEHLFDDA